MNKPIRIARIRKHWNYLESLLSDTQEKSTKSSRYFRSLSSSKGRTTSRAIVIEQRPSPSIRVKRSESFESSTKKPLCVVKGLTSSAVQSIYRAKCRDLGITPTPDQECRFFKFSAQHFAFRRFTCKEAGLGIESASAIASSLRHSQSFGILELARNNLGDVGCNVLVKILVPFIDLAHLDLSNNGISPEGASKLFQRLSRYSTLASLDISSQEGFRRNRLSMLGCLELSRFLQINKIISILNLSDTSIGPEGLEELTKVIKHSSLLSFDISNNPLGPIESFLIQVSSSSIIHLDLSNTGINNESCETVASLLFRSSSLERLCIARNDISTRGASLIFAGIRGNSYLKGLNLDGNPLANGPSAECFDCLKENTTLCALSLARCGMRSGHIRGFGPTLYVNTGLAYLNLSYNGIEAANIEQISAGLALNGKLRVLDLTGNKLKDKGGVALAKALEKNTVLETLLLADNDLKDKTGLAITTALRSNSSVLKISLENNFIAKKLLIKISEGLENNREQFFKAMIPKLRAKIEGIKIEDYLFTIIKQEMQKKKQEKQRIRKNTYKQKEKLEEVQQKEEEKFSELKSQLQKLKEENRALAAQLNEAESEKRNEIIIAERQARVLEGHIEQIALEIKELDIKSKFYSESKVQEQNATKKREVNIALSQYRNELREEEEAHQKAINALETAKLRIEPKIEDREIYYEVKETKTFLASEKLAVSKKQSIRDEPTRRKSKSYTRKK